MMFRNLMFPGPSEGTQEYYKMIRKGVNFNQSLLHLKKRKQLKIYIDKKLLLPSEYL